MLPLLSSALHDWRHLSAALAGVCLAGAAAAALVGESPRWLLSRGRAAEAERVVAWLAAWNGRPLPPGVRLVSGDADDGGGGGSGAGAAKSGREGAAAPAGVAEGGGGRGGRYAALQQEADGEPLEASPQTDLAAGGSGSGSEEGWRLLFSHPLLRRSLLVTSGLAAVSAIIFFVAGLASDALQVGHFGGTRHAAMHGLDLLQASVRAPAHSRLSMHNPPLLCCGRRGTLLKRPSL